MSDMALALETDYECEETDFATQSDHGPFFGVIDSTPMFTADLPTDVLTPFRVFFYPRFSWNVCSAADALWLTSIGSNQHHLDLFYGQGVRVERPIYFVPERNFELEDLPGSAQLVTLVGEVESWAQAANDVPPSPAQAALKAVSDIQRWLPVGQDEVASLAGYAPRSVKNWREGMDPYPSTVRRLFDLHALLGSLTRRLGIEGGRLWLADVDASGARRRNLLADDAGLRSVISEASSILFEHSYRQADGGDFEQSPEEEVIPHPEFFTGPVRRIRRRS